MAHITKNLSPKQKHNRSYETLRWVSKIINLGKP